MSIDVAPGGLQAEVDPDQVRQVLLNLLRNALAAAGKGGRVRTFFSRVDGQVRIHVWDSGGSIATADLPHIFEPFFTKRPGGTGLGLSTVHSIVRAHGGQIRGQLLPWRRHRVRGGVRRSRRARSASVKILVVDDEPSMRQYLEVLLSRSGYEVLTASGRAAGAGGARDRPGGPGGLGHAARQGERPRGAEARARARVAARRSSSSPPTARPAVGGGGDARRARTTTSASPSTTRS